MEIEVPILCGYLNVPTQSGFPLHRISKKKSCQKFCLLFKSSQYGIERLEICESKDDKNPKIVTLENCVKITQEPYPANLIHVVKKTGNITLNALNEDSLKEWVNALQIVAFCSKNESTLTQTAIEEDNDLYCSSYGDGLFIVTLIPSEASIRCNIEPKVYMLHLTATELQLKSTNDLTNIISNWPYKFIRKYGYRNGKFTFEAGRKCFTGEGVFTLDHTNPQEVFRCMSSKMKSMKKMITSDSIKIDICENQLNIAASMEAGSRSPLPPSQFNENITEFEINSTESSFSIRNFRPSCEHFRSVNPKTIPNKPPRKINSHDKPILPLQMLSSENLLLDEKCTKYKKSEAVSITSSSDPNKAAGSFVILKPSSPDVYNSSRKFENYFPKLPSRNEYKCELDYDSITTITDAWKTLGINEVKHNESTSLTDLNNIIAVRPNAEMVSSSKIINIDIGEFNKNHISNIHSDVTYDCLDFLSPNNRTSNGYKTIVTVTPLSDENILNKSQNEYELINVPNANTLHEENYLGYGIFPQSQILSSSAKVYENVDCILNNESIHNISVKVENNDLTSNNDADGSKVNNFNYAIVSKAKQL